MTLLGLIAFSDLARPISNVLYDHLMRAEGFRPTQDIVIVAIDDRTIQEVGGWPIQRQRYADFLSQLDDDCCRPKSIGFDLLFLDSSTEDKELAIQLKKHKSVLPLSFNLQEDPPYALQAQRPVSALAEASQLAHINLSFDTDGVIRGFNPNEQSWPHFALAMQSNQLSTMQSVEGEKYLRFRMVDPSVGFPIISFADATQAKASRTLLKDKYVLIGATASSLGDRYPTLYSGKNSASTPGVAILASVLNASLNNSLIQVAPPWVVFLVTIFPLLLMLQSLLLLSPRWVLGLAGLICLSSVLMSYALLKSNDYWIDPVPLMAVVLMLQPLWIWRRLETIVHFVHEKSADLRRFQLSARTSKKIFPSREVVLQNAKVLDHAVATAHSELVFLASVVDEMPDSVIIFDAQDRLLLCNKKIKELFPAYHFKQGSELTELAAHIQLSPDTLADLELIEQTSRSQKVFQLDTLLEKREFVLKSAKLNSQIQSNYRLVILIDVTDLRQSQKQRDRALQFLSHDMRTPVASILSIVNQTQTLQGSTDLKITHHANTLLGMMDDFILTIASEATHYSLQYVLLDNLIDDALAQVNDLAYAKKIILKDETEASSIFVRANTQLLIRAFINLLFNAIKFAPAQSVIHISTSSDQAKDLSQEHVTVIISNSVSHKSQALDLPTSIPGFGLGLDFVDNVVLKHKGSIHRDIPLDGVATVKINLPCEIAKM